MLNGKINYKWLFSIAMLHVFCGYITFIGKSWEKWWENGDLMGFKWISKGYPKALLRLLIIYLGYHS